ncbi:MAG: hypothetical protein SF028_12015 [Candidatus Sumerlaeia bacterium]|nr:hypothetical protein [Candidatus Sumerlaeia bacterium]
MAKQGAERAAGAERGGWLGTAAASLLLGILVWFIVKNQDTSTTTLNIPVVVVGLDETIEFDLDDATRTVPVVFTFPNVAERLLSPADWRVEVRGSRVRPDPNSDLQREDSEAITVADVVPKPGFTPPEGMMPTGLRDVKRIVWYARYRIWEFDVAPLVTGSPAEGYEASLDTMVVEPPKVRAAITERVEQRLASGEDVAPVLRTEQVSLEGRTRLVEERVRVEYPVNEGIKPLPAVSPQSVSVTVELIESSTSRTFTGVPVPYTPVLAGLDATVFPANVSVTVSGPRSVVAALGPEDLFATVSDVLEEAGSTQEVPVRVTVREEARAGASLQVENSPRTVRVSIEASRTPGPDPRELE